MRKLFVAACRGRNPDNPKSRESGLPTKQMLEINYSNICNAITTVQKDNYVLIFDDHAERCQKPSSICHFTNRTSFMLGKKDK